MGIKAALDALVSIQESIFIPEDVRSTIEGLTVEGAQIQRAYRTIPAESDGLSDLPCFLNTWALKKTERSSSFVEYAYDVRMQLYVLDANQDRGADIANAFMDAINAKFDTANGITLDANISHSNLIGGNPTLVGFVRNGGPYIGLDLHLEIFIKMTSDR